MIEKLSEEIFNKIKTVEWDPAVTRFGFLQSKAIVMEALMQPQEIASGVILKYVNTLWVQDKYLIDLKDTQLFSDKFREAFSKDIEWPLTVVKKFDKFAEENNRFIHEVKFLEDSSLPDLISLFKRYISVLKTIQGFYVFAMPLTNFCEKELSKERPDILEYSYSYKKLDVDYINESIRNLKKLEMQGKLTDKEIQSHLEKFAWIKTSYNLIENYTEEDLRAELKSEVGSNELKPSPEKHFLLTGLQVGIFCRNRIKESSQQIWFAFRPLAQLLAQKLKADLPSFYTLTYQEVLAGFADEALPDKKVIQERREGFAHGFLNSEEILLTGKDYQKIRAYFESPIQEDIKEIKGQIACKGKVTGIAKVIMGHKDFGKLNHGDILVTNITTPSYNVLL